MVNLTRREELLDVLWQIHNAHGYIPDDAITNIANQLQISKIEVESVISFYHFYHLKPQAKYNILFNKSVLSHFAGMQKIKKTFEDSTGVKIGSSDPRGIFHISETSCIGLSDFEPSCLINFHPFISLTPGKVSRVISDLLTGTNLEDIADHPISAVQHTPVKEKSLFHRKYQPGIITKKLASLRSKDILSELENAGLRGMGGAFFPTFIKWKSCADNPRYPKYIVCNADEGEPGTFKDRFLFQYYPGLILEGMIAAGRVSGAEEGIIYLRAEYQFLLDQLNDTIDQFYKKGWLGKNIAKVKGFNFEVRVQLGAGAYVCGEETALLQSMEGYRGEPRPKVYFPTDRGFLGMPTIVNNVETFAAAARIVELGSEFYKSLGTPTSPGNKLLSIAGDCQKPGIYEVPWGITVHELLDLAKAKNTFIVQLSGPSGEITFDDEWDRTIALDDFSCGGSVMIFDSSRNLMDVIDNFNEFFIDESCGICTPCRAGNFILRKELKNLRSELADRSSLNNIYEWSKIMEFSSRCGLGQTAPKSIVQAIQKRRDLFEAIVSEDTPINKSFNIDQATMAYNATIIKNS